MKTKLTKRQQLKEARADWDKSLAVREKARADYGKAYADSERAYDRIQELEKQ